MGVKIAVAGGGSTYTPELVEGFVTRASRIPVDELVLLDVDDDRLEIVGGLARRMLAKAGWGARLTLTTDQDRALDGADFLLVQLRVGGQQARLSDETLPLGFGCIGQETTGPGGFAKALRTVPVVLEMAEETARRAARDAWIIDFTNPTGIVTQALLDDGHRAVGLCNVAIGFQRLFAGYLGVAPDRVELDHVGLNHLTWERAVMLDGRDYLPELLTRHLEELSGRTELPGGLIEELGAVPSYYLRYYYLTAQVLEWQRTHPSRAEEVLAIESELLDMYRNPALAEKPKLLESRGGAFYSEAAAQLVASLHDGRGDVQVVNVRNDGALPGVPDQAVVEIPARIDGTGAHPDPLAPLRPDMLDLVTRAKAYELRTIAAARSGDRDAALSALAANPLVPAGTAPPLLKELLTANRAHLPRFFLN
jgi:6-phospho-beta-glucosidase